MFNLIQLRSNLTAFFAVDLNSIWLHKDFRWWQWQEDDGYDDEGGGGDNDDGAAADAVELELCKGLYHLKTCTRK